MGGVKQEGLPQRRGLRISRALIVSYLSILGVGTQESHGTEKATQANPDTSALTGNALYNLTTITEEKELFFFVPSYHRDLW